MQDHQLNSSKYGKMNNSCNISNSNEEKEVFRAEEALNAMDEDEYKRIRKQNPKRISDEKRSLLRMKVSDMRMFQMYLYQNLTLDDNLLETQMSEKVDRMEK
ncbi:hypothetical protein L6452_21991 [Arctium lappa]|uniref:Uncharacterized protein n=1 Tax=Arctium lappa TaxID=4217 RepID=A0ACB9AYK8_ARCLA|nr:hypothetical protein L6452_21991 [Arctium lappa]